MEGEEEDQLYTQPLQQLAQLFTTNANTECDFETETIDESVEQFNDIVAREAMLI